MDKISVIIPTYNRCELLKRSIDSVLTQTYEDIELIIVDDGSTDGTKEMVEAIEDERVRYIQMPTNMGAAAARNEGVKNATADLIAFHDSDDCWREDKLEKQMAYWNEHPEFAMVYCPYIVRGKEVVAPTLEWGLLEGNILAYLLLRNSIGTPTMLMKKDCFEEIGGFNSLLKCLEDWEFAIRFAEQFRIGFVNEVLVDVYHTAGSISMKIAEYYEARCYMVAKYRVYMERYRIFDAVVASIFEHAEGNGVLQEVKAMLMKMLERA